MGANSSTSLRVVVMRVLAATIALVVATSSPAFGSARSEREKVRREQAQAAAKLDAAKADKQKVAAALDALAANVRSQESRYRDAVRAADAAEAEAEQARADEARTRARIGDLEDEVAELAVSSYMRPDAGTGLLQLGATDITEAAERKALLDQQAGRNASVLDELRAAREDLTDARARAEAASAEAEVRRKDVGGKLSSLKSAKAEQARVVSAAAARVERALSEAAVLADRDKKLSAQIEAENRALASRVARAGGGGSGRSVVAHGRIVSVRGISVDESIADNLDRMLAKAESQGHRFTGGGYRSSDGQIATRKANCGSSSYAIYEAPASSCSPPTARPGQSMHERGLAIDFSYNGALIQSRSNAGYQWLASNASAYGFYNLPSEPWHWSTNGN